MVRVVPLEVFFLAFLVGGVGDFVASVCVFAALVEDVCRYFFLVGNVLIVISDNEATANT